MKHLVSIRAARYFRKSQGVPSVAVEMAEGAKDPVAVSYMHKALIPALSMDSLGFSASQSPEAVELSRYLLEDSVTGIVAAKAIGVPFHTTLGALKGIGVAWVGEGMPVRLQAGEASTAKLEPLKLSSMVVVDRELEELATPGTDAAISGLLKSASARELDGTFLSDAEAVEDVSPAGVLLGAAGASDYPELFKTHVDNGNNLSSSLLVMPVDTLLGLTGDFIQVLNKTGITLVASQYAQGVSLIDAGSLMMNLSGTLVESSDKGTVEMDDAPTNDAVTPTASQQISLFQTNAIAYRANTYANWSAVPGTTPVTILQ